MRKLIAKGIDSHAAEKKVPEKRLVNITSSGSILYYISRTTGSCGVACYDAY